MQLFVDAALNIERVLQIRMQNGTFNYTHNGEFCFRANFCILVLPSLPY
jgi:flagellar basal body rod protein FlgG